MIYYIHILIEDHNKYICDPAATTTGIRALFINDKYAPLWTDINLTPEIIQPITRMLMYDTVRALMHKYKISYAVIRNDKVFLKNIYLYDNTIKILNKYDAVEQRELCRAIIYKRLYKINSALLYHIIPLCNYSIVEWQDYDTIVTKKYYFDKSCDDIIKNYTDSLILYNNSLRNTWIMVCITF